jgi:hypothetical protein
MCGIAFAVLQLRAGRGRIAEIETGDIGNIETGDRDAP